MAKKKKKKKVINKSKSIDVALGGGLVQDFTIKIDGKTLPFGDYLDLTEGTMMERVKVLGKYIAINGKLLGADAGYQFLRKIPVGNLEGVFKTIEDNIIGESDPN